MTKIYILPLLAALTFSLNAQAEKLMTKEEFYAKHNIVGDSLIPPSFDMEDLKKALMEHKYTEEEINRLIERIKEDMTPPTIFEGFYSPEHTILGCYRDDGDCLKKIGLTDEDIATKFPITSKKEKQKEFEEYGEVLEGVIGRVGDNIYITSVAGDCGTVGCGAELAIKENEKWKSQFTPSEFSLCFLSKNIEKSHCDIYGGFTISWRYDIDYYPPLQELYNRYYDVNLDYIHQYIQRQEDKND